MPETYSRRTLLQAAAFAALGLCLPARAGARPEGSTSSPVRWAMAVDLTRFTEPGLVGRLAWACHRAHNVPDIPAESGPDQRIAWIWSEPPVRVFPDPAAPRAPEALWQALEKTGLPVLCNHCDDPPCVRVCPTGATFKQADGLVAQDPHRCIGCRYCMAACPYGSRSFNFRDPAPFVASPDPDYPLRMRGVVEKCTFCPERLAEDKAPYCVAASEGALVFGNLADRDSALSRMLADRPNWRRKAHLGTGPAVFYVL